MRRRAFYRKILRNKEPGIINRNSMLTAKRLDVLNKIFSAVLGVVLPILLVVFGFVIQKNDPRLVADLFAESKGILFLNLIIVYFIYFVLNLMINKPCISYFITSVLYLALPAISRLKYDVRGEVLLHNDFSLAGQLGEITEFVSFDGVTVALILLVLLFIISSTITLVFQKIKSNRITSAIASFIMTVLVFFAFILPVTSNAILEKFGINTSVRYSPNIIHERYGTLIGLYVNYQMNRIKEPDDYSIRTVFQILDDAEKIKKESQPATSTQTKNNKKSKKTKKSEQPKIIMIMSESFFDPTRLKGVTYSEDPIPTVRSMCEKYTSGTLVTSTFAGATSNVEFEAFTGESTEFLPYGTVPYTDLKEQIRRSDTIQKVLKNDGYKTIGIHTYDGEFYNRRENYQYLGFDEFKDMNEVKNPGYYGKYVSDFTLTENIIKELEDNKNNEPLYIWALTMQNHTPYSTANYDEDALKIKVSGEKLSDIALDKVTAYVNGLHESDRCLKRLIEYLDKSERKTVLLFYGDHLPSLYEAYYDTGMISTKDTSKWTTAEMLELHKIPIFIYNNYNLKQDYNHHEILGAMLLGNRLLNEAGVNKSAYFDFLDTINYSALRDRLFVDDKGNVYSSGTEECQEKLNQHKMLQYDMLYGKNYISEYDKIY